MTTCINNHQPLEVEKFNELFHVRADRGKLQSHPDEDPFQDKIVACVLTCHSILSTIVTVISFVVYPILKLFEALSYVVTRFILKGRVESQIIKDINQQQTEASPPTIKKIHVGDKKHCFDSKFFYCVNDGKLWFKPIGVSDDAPWRLFEGTGLPSSVEEEDVQVEMISADGDNLIAVDSKKRLHYTKTNEIDLGFTEDGKDWNVTAYKTCWTTSWFNMYIVAPIRNFLINPTIFVDLFHSALSEGNKMYRFKALAMSQKGSDVLYYTDTIGKKHPEPFVGVTTLYALSEDGTEIFFGDPWMANQFENSFTGPEEGTFAAENLSASASTLFLIRRYRDENGKERNRMYTRFVDFDSSKNPLLPGTYDPNNPTPLVRYQIPEDWALQPEIELAGEAKLTSDITITQCGRGNKHRMLYARGTNEKGETGYYHKLIYDQTWTFQKTDEEIDQSAFLGETEESPKSPDNTHVRNLVAKTIRSNLSFMPNMAYLDRFLTRGENERGLHTTLELDLDHGKRMYFYLRSTKGVSHFMKELGGGKQKELNWDLIVPDEYFSDPDPRVKEVLAEVFKGKHNVPVEVEEGEIIKVRADKLEFVFKEKERTE